MGRGVWAHVAFQLCLTIWIIHYTRSSNHTTWFCSAQSLTDHEDSQQHHKQLNLEIQNAAKTLFARGVLGLRTPVGSGTTRGQEDAWPKGERL